jgi:dTDP-4-dehydrorhamnose reductase
MLGHMVYQVLSQSEGLEVHGTCPNDRRDVFYFDVESGMTSLSTICEWSGGCDYFINCIGMLAAKIKPEEPISVRRGIHLNALFPHELSAFARQRGIRIIHISTDGVFLGDAESYDEAAPHDCMDLYGITKSLGEVTDEIFLNFRCSIVGPSPYERGGLLEWFLGQPEGSTVSGFTDQIWHGVSTYQFAKLCLAIIERDHFDMLRKESPVFHFSPNEPVSKYELISLFRETFNKSVKVKATESYGKTFKRILHTKFKGLEEIYHHGLSAREMVSELAVYMKSNKKENYIG